MRPVFSRWLLRGLGLGAAAAFASACQEELPSAPDDLAQGITVYAHANSAGESAHLTSDADDLSGYHGEALGDARGTRARADPRACANVDLATFSFRLPAWRFAGVAELYPWPNSRTSPEACPQERSLL